MMLESKLSEAESRKSFIFDEETIVGLFLRNVIESPDKAALIFPALAKMLTFRDLQDASLAQAKVLREAGIVAGEIVMIFLPSHPDAYVAFVAALLIGAVPTFMPTPSVKQDPHQYWRDHAALLARTRPRLLVTDAATREAMMRSGLLDAYSVEIMCFVTADDPLPHADLPDRSGADVAFLQHSSGTTSLKKGVMLSNAAVVAQATALGRALGSTKHDVVATWLPVYHDMGLLSSTLLPLMMGQTSIVLDPFAWAAHPVTLFQAIDRYDATLVWQPNFAFEHLVRTVQDDEMTFDLSRMRAFINCSEPCRSDTMERFAARFAPCGVRRDQLQASYAMAETVFAVTQTRPGDAPRTLTVADGALRDEALARPAEPGEASLTLFGNGPVLDGIDLSVVAPDGSVRAEGEVGEFVIRGACLFDGYFRLPELTADRLKTDGLHTRDLGFVMDGHAYVLGRLDDLIIVHGRNFFAGEVEAAVSRVSGVKAGRAVAFGIDNPAVGSQDVMVVAETDSPDTRDLARQIKRVVLQEVGLTLYGALLVPPGWLIKTTSGKISRERNRARYLSEKAAASGSRTTVA
jgi:fatty-acyl-CoA synthase